MTLWMTGLRRDVFIETIDYIYSTLRNTHVTQSLVLEQHK